jgi:imidazolonepropionase-like amidohydrolase
MQDKALLVSAGQLIDGRGGAPVADAGVLVDADGRISWVGPMAQAPPLPDHGQRVALAGTLLPGFIDTHVHFAVPGGGLNVGKLMRQPPPVRVLQIAGSMRATVEGGSPRFGIWGSWARSWPCWPPPGQPRRRGW